MNNASPGRVMPECLVRQVQAVPGGMELDSHRKPLGRRVLL
jgi:hypothetical protein